MCRRVNGGTRWSAAPWVTAMVTLVLCATMSCAAPAQPKHFRYVIPEGAAERVSKNENPVVMPADLVVHVGDTITILNEDRYDQNIGPYFVGGNSKVTQKFLSPTVYEGKCAFTGKGSFKITVLARD